ncbi:exosortase family protein XrtF [Flavobacterium cyanobacteriorum]|uniref:Exosortase family protein XrtF n=1 Tax=Flavobacterium cyanobacteriorum TaxID=2022802 RepID=A0A255ZYA6_9FLAO|nr:exosortase family protein XrtF [Flavobacterium cyanobacteriorum]OYQ46478.1 exosortase family protein XrtF [Flavobacterium cyanobacteriorum]
MDIFRKNRAFFLFLLKFGIAYLLLSGMYWLYLSQYDAEKNEVDGMTKTVARQAEAFVDFLGEDAFTRPRVHESAYRFFINGKSLARIVEGCNAISVMILFASFIVAFSTTLKRTLSYIILGIIFMHFLNVARVGLLCLSFYYYPQYKTVMHDIVFPAFIYGVVFILWILWIIKFSGNAEKTKT